MKKKIFLLIIPIIIIGLTLSIFLFNRKDYKVNKILNNEYYSYLPTEAKEVVKDVYEKTGKVIPTEKNKEEDKPYLNPQYVDYLQLSDAEKKKVEVIPSMYTMEHAYTSDELEGTATEASYDLRNYNYLTPMKDQGSLGICWAFATVEQAESFAMVKNHQPYNASTKIFSPRQLDYATSYDGILDFDNEHGIRSLTSGGNFELSAEILSYGVSLIDESKMPYNTSTTQKELSDVFSFTNSNYEVNNTISLPKIIKRLKFDLPGADTTELKNNYIQKIKEGIKAYGGAVVETVTPEGNCGFKTKEGYYGLETTNNCYSTNDGHAMQLIGWDDNFTYSYCKNSGYNSNVIPASNSCSSGTKVTGKGAFLVRNSWGNDERRYVYLTYNSINAEDASAVVNFISNMTPTLERTWDNYYMHSVNFAPGVTYWFNNVSNQTFEKKISGKEKLQKVKFNAYAADQSYNITITSNGKSYTYYNVVTANYPGIYTIDLSNKNIILDGDTFNISISVADGKGGLLIEDSISAYTSNVDSTPMIESESVNEIKLPAGFTPTSRRIVFNTKNIESGESLSITLKTFDDKDKSGSANIFHTTVAENNVNASVTFLPLSVGYYKLTASYRGVTEEIPVTVGTPDPLVAISATPSSVNFGTVDDDFTTEKYSSVIIKNIGNVDVKINMTKPTSSGPFDSYTKVNNKTIKAGESFIISLMLNPNGTNHNVPGTYNGTYKITATSVEDSSNTYTLNIPATVKINKAPQAVRYTTHVENIGWQPYVKDGAMAGTSGKALRLEGIRIKLTNQEYTGNVLYRTHIENIGWESNFKKNDEMSGTSGRALRLEAIEIKLDGEMANHYDIYYRVHAENFGWLGWARNGEQSGTAGYAYRLEGIQIKLVPKGTIFSEYGEKYTFIDKSKGKTTPIGDTKLVAYTTHVENVGWQDYVTDGAMAGTSGKALRLEGIKIKLNNKNYSGDILYRTHIENLGWETSFKKNDQMSGTSGRALRLEAIEIKLEGEIANYYDVYYRVHAQEFGWLAWAKNGEQSGTAGYAYRLEGIEIVLVSKGLSPPARANQNQSRAFIQR